MSEKNMQDLPEIQILNVDSEGISFVENLFTDIALDRMRSG